MQPTSLWQKMLLRQESEKCIDRQSRARQLRKRILPNRRLRECVQRPNFLRTLQDCDLEQLLRDRGIVQLPTVAERRHASYRLSNQNSTGSIHGSGTMRRIARGFVDLGPTSHTHLQQMWSQDGAVLRLGQISGIGTRVGDVPIRTGKFD